MESMQNTLCIKESNTFKYRIAENIVSYLFQCFQLFIYLPWNEKLFKL